MQNFLRFLKEAENPMKINYGMVGVEAFLSRLSDLLYDLCLLDMNFAYEAHIVFFH